MTKMEAVVAMKNGEKVTHRYFSEDEYVTIKDGYYVFEDEVKCPPVEFWILRTGKEWLTDWSIKKED